MHTKINNIHAAGSHSCPEKQEQQQEHLTTVFFIRDQNKKQMDPERKTHPMNDFHSARAFLYEGVESWSWMESWRISVCNTDSSVEIHLG